MTEALNFTTKAIEDLAWLAQQPHIGAADKAGILFVQRLLQRAEVFVLPDAGQLLDRSKPRPQMPGAVFHPPFPVVALEYRAVPGSGTSHPLYEATVASKRIALAWEWDGRMPSGMSAANGPAIGEGVVVASVSYMDDIGRWVPMMAAVMVPYDCIYVKAAPTELQRAFVESGRITETQANAEKIEIRAVLPIMGDAMALAARQGGMSYAYNVISADLMDELNAYIDLMTALSCNNVGKARNAQPEKLNRARIKGGKAPLKDFHVLTISGSDSGFERVGDGRGMRSHLRRGHIRRLNPHRVTWVNACMVRGSNPGFVDKHYAASAAA